MDSDLRHSVERLLQKELARYSWAIVMIALAETAQFMMSKAETGNPLCIYIGFIAQTAVLALAWRRPDRLRGLVAKTPFAVIWAALFAISVLVLYLPVPFPLLCCAATVFKASEMLAVLTAADALFGLIPTRRVAPVALGGIVIAFGAAVVLFSLPSTLSTFIQAAIAAVCAVTPALASRHSSNRSAEPVGVSCGRTPQSCKRVHAPAALIMTICFFSIGIQLTYMSLWSECDWAVVYAIAIVLSIIFLIIEFKTYGLSRFSLLDLTCASFIAVSVIYVGAGMGSGATSVAMASIGFCLFIPRILQISGTAARDGDADPLPVFAEAQFADWLANVVATVCMASGAYSALSANERLSIGVIIALGCIFGVFALYDARTRSAIFDFIEEAPANAAHTGNEVTAESREPDAAPSLEDVCQALAYEHNLTNKETQVLTLVASGASLGRVCDEMCVSMSTAKSHVYHIYQKLGVHSRDELNNLLKQVQNCKV